jgi:sugar phosphate isomerase/epimerase
MIRNTNDGSLAPPSLHVHFNLGTLMETPDFSSAPRSQGRELYEAIKAAGFSGIQGGDPAIAGDLGMPTDGDGRVNKVGDADAIAASAKDRGLRCATLHVGWGVEDDAEVDRLVEDIIRASEKRDFPLYIETHRATITQDIWRTVRFVKKFPDVRINGDFSHWYTGLEMVYGNITEKWDFAAPVFDRVRYVHGRIGNPGNMQVDIGDGKGQTYVDHFREMWTRSFAGFLKTAKPGDYITFAPELLGPSIYYARAFHGREEGDRWQQAILYAQIAKECFAEAQKRVK